MGIKEVYSLTYNWDSSEPDSVGTGVLPSEPDGVGTGILLSEPDGVGILSSNPQKINSAVYKPYSL